MQHATQSPTEDSFVQNPYPFYDKIRQMGPLTFWEDYGMPAAASYEVVNALLRDRRFGREDPFPPERPAHQAAFWAVEDHSMLELEPPRHTQLRAAVLRAFTSRRIQMMATSVRDLAEDLCAKMPDGQFDLLDALARPLPVQTIARLLGVPEQDAPDLLRWSNAMVGMYQAGRTKADEVVAAEAAGEFSDYLAKVFDTRRTAPQDDLVSRLLDVANDGQLSAAEVTATCILLLNAGHEATVHTFGNGIAGMIRAGHWGTPVTPALVEEVLRHDPPLHLFTRYAQEDVEVYGHRFAKGEQVALLLGAANRDPAAYDTPDQFVPDRFEDAVKPGLSFGAGIHFCLGAHLARMELFEGLQALSTARPDLSLAQPPRYADIYHFHGLSELIVR